MYLSVGAIFCLALLSVCSAEDLKVTKTAWFDVTHGGRTLGRIVFGLFGGIVPKTVDNFYKIATNPPEGVKGYTGSPFHRVIKDFMVQGGDTTTGDGMGGRSIYGETFADENFDVKMNGPGWLCMANAGKDTNKSQFFITTADTPWLNGKHVCFGKVTEGMGIVDQMQNVDNDNSKPKEKLEVSNAGGQDADFTVDTNPVPIPT